jgi:hypothetical protein
LTIQKYEDHLGLQIKTRLKMSDKRHIRCQCRRSFNPCLLEEAEELIQNVGLGVPVSEDA